MKNGNINFICGEPNCETILHIKENLILNENQLISHNHSNNHSKTIIRMKIKNDVILYKHRV